MVIPQRTHAILVTRARPSELILQGNEASVAQLRNKIHDGFLNSTFAPWITHESGMHADEVGYAGGDGDTVTFVKD